MSELYIVVEGQTEQTFVREILAPYLAVKGVYCTAILLGKRGRKGGNVSFARAKNNIERLLKQRSEIYVTTFFDYYGLQNWPGKSSVLPHLPPDEKASICEDEATQRLEISLSKTLRVQERCVPYLMMHEFEALLFSDIAILAQKIGVQKRTIEKTIAEFDNPEAINDSPLTAPSKRIEKLSTIKYKKTVTGITIARKIGIDKMRSHCPHFDSWVSRLEGLT